MGGQKLQTSAAIATFPRLSGNNRYDFVNKKKQIYKK
jgi:hypothetical protein